MDQIVFEYQGRTLSAQLISSTQMEPHYHWVYFNDAQIASFLDDDCIGFKQKGNGLQPTRTYVVHRELVETVQRAVETHIS